MLGIQGGEYVKKLKLDDHVQINLIPYEERKGIKMTYAIDRAHYKRRIPQTENIFIICASLETETMWISMSNKSKIGNKVSLYRKNDINTERRESSVKMTQKRFSDPTLIVDYWDQIEGC